MYGDTTFMSQEEHQNSSELQKSIIPEETSKRITALRFFLAILVVFIHNNYTLKNIADAVAKGEPEILFSPNTLSKWIQLFISQGIAKCAVPLFFMFAAYLQAIKADSYKVLLKKKFKALFFTYFLWIGLYGFYSSVVKIIILKIAPSFIENPDTTMFTWTITDWIHKIVGYGTGDGTPGFAEQFWFVRDLFILVIVSQIIQFLLKKFKLGFFILVFIIYFLKIKVYFVRTTALFFYVSGLYWGYYNFNLFKIIDKIKFSEVIIVWIFSFLWEFIGFDEGNAIGSFTELSSCVLLLKLSANIIKNEKIYNIANYLSGFSFFLYAIHMPLLSEYLKKLWIHFFPMKNGFFCLFEYFGVTILIVVIGTGIGIVLKKICPKLFILLNGGRK